MDMLDSYGDETIPNALLKSIEFLYLLIVLQEPILWDVHNPDIFDIPLDKS